MKAEIKRWEDILNDQNPETSKMATAFAIGDAIMMMFEEEGVGKVMALNVLTNLLGAVCLDCDDPRVTAEEATSAVKQFVAINLGEHEDD